MVKLLKPKYVYRKVRRNKRRPDTVYWYSEPPGMAREIVPHPPGTAEFNAFAAARNRTAERLAETVLPGTFLNLADVYRGVPVYGVSPSKKQAKADPLRYGDGPVRIEASQAWRNLAPKTRKDYTRYVDEICRMWGPDLVRDLEVEMLVVARDARRDRPRVANYLLNVTSAMLGVALERHRTFGIGVNVAANVKRLGVKSGVKARTAYWTYARERKFLEDADKADPTVALAERLLAYTGQRPGDVRAMLLADYDGEKIRVVQSKTGARVWIRVHKDLKPHLDAAVAEARAAGIVNGAFIRGIRGEAMGERYFATRWDAVAARTGCAELQRRDLRRTAVIRLAEAGCTVPEIAAITGHSLRQVEVILETYFVRTYEMAEAAILKLETYQDGRKATEN